MSTTPLLEVSDLHVRFTTPAGPVQAVAGLSFSLSASETLAIVGESGSGKTQAALALLGLLADNGRASGSARLEGEELIGQPARVLNRVRGARIGMVFQDPMTSLNPFLTIGDQMGQVLARHRPMARAAARAECCRLLDAVGISAAARRLTQYPHELSGGMRQRVMIAAALLCRPALLIADEPTTALDVTVQAQILALLGELRREFATAVLLITHDLGIVAGTCERMLVMQRGALVEQGTVDQVYAEPAHPYTRRLLAAAPRLDAPRSAAVPLPADSRMLLAAEEVSVRFRLPPERLFSRARELQAVSEVSLTVAERETLGIVGESGCGKSTLARALLRLVEPAAGRVQFDGRELTALDRTQLKAARRDLQLVFQDPLAALDPRMTVRDIVAEPLRTFRPELRAAEVTAEVTKILEEVGLEAAHLYRYPHQFSGGQCQRIGIARALILRPKLLVCDEPVSALDVTIQSQIINLLRDLQERFGLTLLFIAHDLAVVREISHRVMVMYLGRVVELAPVERLYASPEHPYTRALLAAVPIPDPERERNRVRTPLAGEPPSAFAPPSGCAFRTRCPHAIERCAEERPALRDYRGALVACHLAGKLGEPGRG
ncbi:MAG: ABC transporter ATP-binding protein [Chromatiales bacterium]|nr:ABC transporter ATP-binding protein [Chromatiales bacterium]